MFSTRLKDALRRPLSTFQNHPFNQEIINGSLPGSVFSTYLVQDNIYLSHYSKTLKQTAARLDNLTDKAFLTQLADYDLDKQMRIHQKFLEPLHAASFFSIKLDKKPIPAVAQYLVFQQALSLAPVYVTLSGLCPCLYLYAELGKSLYEADIQPDNPYQIWIHTYKNPKFFSESDLMLSTLDRMADDLSIQEQEKMIEAALFASDHELAFCDAMWAPLSEKILNFV